MNKQKQVELKKSYNTISELLKDNSLTDEERAELEKTHTELAGAYLSSWLPFGYFRKLLMLIIFLIGLYGIIKISIFFIIIWIVLPFFSPRIAGETAAFFGKLLGKK